MFVSILPCLIVLMSRFLGLFIILPVVSVLVSGMHGANELTVGLSVGLPYLVQAIFQPFFGRLSDVFPRKYIVLAGLLIFLLGSIVCMSGDSIYSLMLGRCLQGAGAIGGVLSALVADSVPEEYRTRAMAIMGGGIFASFVLAMLLGSIIGFQHGLQSLFLLTSILTFVSILIVALFVKNTAKVVYIYPPDSKPSFDSAIKVLYLSSFLQKFFMILTFSLTPIILGQHMPGSEFYKTYILAIIFGVLTLGPSSVIGEKRGRSREIVLASICTFALGWLFMDMGMGNVSVFTVGFALFFSSFSTQEALLQGMISKLARAKHRGRILGDFAAAGYGGSFLGAVMGGMFFNHEALHRYADIMFFGLFALCVVWFFVCRHFLINPERNTRTMYIASDSADASAVHDLEGIIEWYENESEKFLVIKYDMSVTGESMIRERLCPRS